MAAEPSSIAMLEKPDLADGKIQSCLRDAYGLTDPQPEFLPIGNDASAWAYRVRSAGGQFFLKLRRGPLYQAGLSIPHYLRAQGLHQVIAPLADRRGKLWSALEDYHLILYPFIEGFNGMDAGLSPAQWEELGTALHRMHAMDLPPELMALLKRETFRPAWAGMLRRLDTAIQTGDINGSQQQALAGFWLQKRPVILRILDRAEELGRELSMQQLSFVLCHADIHTANVLIQPDGLLHIVDWDGVILAPKERDLMFMTEQPADEQARIFRGYGPAEVDRTAIAYYRHEWVVQEIGDFGERIFFSRDSGTVTRDDSLRGFRALFDPDDVVVSAFRSDTGSAGF